MKAGILKFLKEADGYVSGQELCGYFGVSRTAIWKAVRQLRADGYDIEAIRSRGYRLKEGSDIYTEAELKSVLRTKWLGQNLVFLEMVDSTNNEACRLAQDGAPEGTLVAAVEQSAGKGRRGRSWISPKGTGLWMSFLLRPEIPPESASMLTLITAMAVADGIHEAAGICCGIKWPNDIVIDGKKVCGILTEMSSDMDTIQHIIVGIGINVGMEEFPAQLGEAATSLKLVSDTPVSRAGLADAVLRSWEHYYEIFLQTFDLSALAERYNRRLVSLDREVRVLDPRGEYRGISGGITEKGELIVRLFDGGVRKVASGEVSVRGIYGYV